MLSSFAPLAIRCPACTERLDVQAEAACCTSCGQAYAIRDGVVCLLDRFIHTGEFSPEQMAAIKTKARSEGWQAAAEDFALYGRDEMAAMLTDLRRIGFAKALSLRVTDEVLDVGCGMGGISMMLADKVSAVVSLDQSIDRASFLAIMAAQRPDNNITVICADDVLHLPFPDASFHMVTLIGVLEYFPLSYPDMRVDDVQEKALREIFRVLKPGGTLVLGTKNRFGWNFWRGARDHNGLKFGPVLPRGLAAFLKRRRGGVYRIVVDSYSGYRRALEQCGFRDLAFFWPLPSYQFMGDLVPLDSQARTVPAATLDPALPTLKKAIIKLMRHIGLLKYLVPHFVITARKADAING